VSLFVGDRSLSVEPDGGGISGDSVPILLPLQYFPMVSGRLAHGGWFAVVEVSELATAFHGTTVSGDRVTGAIAGRWGLIVSAEELVVAVPETTGGISMVSAKPGMEQGAIPPEGPSLP